MNNPEGDLSVDRASPGAAVGELRLPRLSGLGVSLLEDLGAAFPKRLGLLSMCAPMSTNPDTSPRRAATRFDYYFSSRDGFIPRASRTDWR